MLTRIIPVLTIKDRRMIKTVMFDQYYDVGDPITTGKYYNSQDVDELVLLDITATQERRVPDFETIRDFCAECLMPLTVGGGIRSLDTINQLLKLGADKIVLNSFAVEQPGFITKASLEFGSQCIVVSIDARRQTEGRYTVYTEGGSLQTGLCVEDWVKRIEEQGAGEIIINSIDRDGTMSGYDEDLVKMVVETTQSIPVVALGGAGVLHDIVDVYSIARPSAIAMSSIFHFTDNKPVKANAYAIENGIDARII